MAQYDRLYPQTVTPDGTDVETGFSNDDNELKRIYSILSSLGALNLSGTKRQSVLYGSTDISGNPNYLTASGLNVSIDGSTVPIILAFANGFNDSGSVDVLDKIASAISNAYTLPPNQTVYLYVDKDINNGLLSYNYTLSPDQYLKVAPSSPVLDQHYYNINEAKMYRYNGLAWEVKQRIFWAKAVTDASATTLTIYPLGSKVPIIADDTTPVGRIVTEMFVRPGYIKAIGQVVNRTDFPKLWDFANTNGLTTTEANWSAGLSGLFSVGDGSATFRIPDLRGDDIRTLDDGRYVDKTNITGNTTSGSTTISGITSTVTLAVGMPISGNGIPTSATIASIVSSTSITISAAATATATGVILTISGRVLGSLELDAEQGHKHGWSGSPGSPAVGDYILFTNSSSSGVKYNNGGITDDGMNGTPRIGPETRGRNVAYYRLIKY